MSATTTLAIPTTSQAVHAVNATSNVSSIANATTTLATTLVTKLQNATKASSTMPTSVKSSVSTVPETTTTVPTEYDSGYMESRIIFLFCTVLLIVATMLIIKIVTSNKRKKRTSFSGLTDRWRISTSRTSAQVGRVHGSGLMSGTAIYTAMPQNADLANPQARLDWERQFFDEENVGNPLEDESYTSSRLQLNLN